MIGSVIGSYRIVRQLGEGGMGVVYIGQHQTLGHEVAIKLLKPELSRNAEIVNRFFDEARASSLVQHPAIVQVFDFGTKPDGAAYFVMELLEGESLADRMSGPAIGPVAAARIGRQVAEALATTHQVGIIHRDLKPENVFLSRDTTSRDGERVKLLDFGIAKLADELRASDLRTRQGTLMGSPLYMSPEQCRGAEAVTDRTDVYSLGCVLYHAIAGKPPFVSDSLAEILGAHQHAAPIDLSVIAPSTPPVLLSLIDRCLAKDPSTRPPMSEVASVLAGLESATRLPAPTVTSQPPQAQPQPTRPASGGSSAGLWIAASAVILVGAGAAIAVGLSSGEPEPSAAPSPDAARVVASAPIEDASPVSKIHDAAPLVPDAAPAIAAEKKEPRGKIHVVPSKDWITGDVIKSIKMGLSDVEIEAVEAAKGADGTVSARCRDSMTNKVYKTTGSYGSGIRGSRVRCTIKGRAGSWRTSFKISGETPSYVYDGKIFDAAIRAAKSDAKLRALPYQLAVALGDRDEAVRILLNQSITASKSRFIISFLRSQKVDLSGPRYSAYVLVASGKLDAAARLGEPALEPIGIKLRSTYSDKKRAAVIDAAVKVGPAASKLIVKRLELFRPQTNARFANKHQADQTAALIAALGKIGGKEHLPFLEGYAADVRPKVSQAASVARASITERVE